MFTIADLINYTFNNWINNHPEATEEQMHKAFNRIRNKLYKEYGVTGQPV